MKKLYLYVILILFEIAFGLIYGFILQNVFSIETYLIIAFLIPFVLLTASSRKNQGKIIEKVIKILILSLLLTVLSFASYFFCNRTNGEFVDEYEVVVEYVGGRGGGSASFRTPNGEYGDVDLHDYRPILTDEDEYVSVGDIIRVQEYKGIFGMPYYVFVEEVN